MCFLYKLEEPRYIILYRVFSYLLPFKSKITQLFIFNHEVFSHIKPSFKSLEKLTSFICLNVVL